MCYAADASDCLIVGALGRVAQSSASDGGLSPTQVHNQAPSKDKYKVKDKDNDKDRHAGLSPHNATLYKVNMMSHT